MSSHVTRAPHPTDRRRVIVKCTSKADEDLAEEIAPMAMHTLKLAKSLAADERQAVGRFLDSLVSVAEGAAAEACLR